MTRPIRVLVTGGTFDKEYNELTGELFFKNTHVREMLRLGRCLLDVEVETLMMIDSLQMTDEGRRSICERCRTCEEHHIVITHGTDTMEQTAAALGEAVENRDRIRSDVTHGRLRRHERPLPAVERCAEEPGTRRVRTGHLQCRPEVKPWRRSRTGGPALPTSHSSGASSSR